MPPLYQRRTSLKFASQRVHTHPLGLLHYSATELVILFHSSDKLQCATCGIVKVMELQGEAITVKAMAPSEAHIKAYLVALQLNPSNGEGELHTPPQQTPPSRGMPHCLQAELGDLASHKLHHLMEDLTQEIAQSKVNVPPSSPPPNTWVHPSVSGNPKEDDWEVTFPGEGRWSPSRHHSISRDQAISWRRGSLWTTTASTMSCSIWFKHGATDYHPGIGFALGHPKN